MRGGVSAKTPGDSATDETRAWANVAAALLPSRDLESARTVVRGELDSQGGVSSQWLLKALRVGDRSKATVVTAPRRPCLSCGSIVSPVRGAATTGGHSLAALTSRAAGRPSGPRFGRSSPSLVKVRRPVTVAGQDDHRPSRAPLLPGSSGSCPLRETLPLRLGHRGPSARRRTRADPIRLPRLDRVPDLRLETSMCLAVLLTVVDALAGALLGARGHAPGELRAMFGYPAISVVGESGKARESSCREPTGRQHSQELWQCRAARVSLAGRGYQMPRRHSLRGRELLEQVAGFRALQRDRM
jgi:hypothetical protein